MRVNGAGRTRTADARFRKPTLYPLSYSPVTSHDTTAVNGPSLSALQGIISANAEVSVLLTGNWISRTHTQFFLCMGS
jgi:hypothetical protein